MSETTNTAQKKSWIERHPVITVICAILVVGTMLNAIYEEDSLAVITDPAPVQEITEEVTEPTFSELAQARFDELTELTPELDKVDCGGPCNSSAFFFYNTLPTDLEFITRGNAAAFSRFKMENGGFGSHVTIFAKVGGVTVLECDAAEGLSLIHI